MRGEKPEVVAVRGDDPKAAILNPQWFEDVYNELMADLLVRNADDSNPYTFEDVVNWVEWYRSGLEDAAMVLRDVASLPMYNLTDQDPDDIPAGLIHLAIGQQRFAPAFQFQEDRTIRPEVLDTNLRLYGKITIWGAAHWWMFPIPELDNLSPLHVLELAPENLNSTHGFLP